ncbi:hypothetical protein QE152_g5043 [Popillia japonica]|uniref:Uncharacterized protein n=1 Tax=Popillia japonica TaxID=7064 RepID=A0AAW1MYC8_POPJA
MQCCGIFHPACTNVPLENVRYLTAGGVLWKRSECRDADCELSSAADDGVDAAGSHDSKRMDQILKTLCSLQTTSVLQSVKFCSDKITDFEVTLKNIDDKVKTIDKLSIENAA